MSEKRTTREQAKEAVKTVRQRTAKIMPESSMSLLAKAADYLNQPPEDPDASVWAEMADDGVWYWEG